MSSVSCSSFRLIDKTARTVQNGIVCGLLNVTWPTEFVSFACCLSITHWLAASAMFPTSSAAQGCLLSISCYNFLQAGKGSKSALLFALKPSRFSRVRLVFQQRL